MSYLGKSEKIYEIPEPAEIPDCMPEGEPEREGEAVPA